MVAYTYDQNSRVTGITYTAGSTQLGNLSYGYDADGRVVEKSGSLAQTGFPQAVSGNLFNADNELVSFGGQVLGYDANGNLLSDGNNSYSWDARNHLSAIAGLNSVAFSYDALGRRAAKGVNGTVTQFLYDGLNPVQELDGGSPPNITANLLTGLGLDEYFQRIDSAGAMNFLADTLGSTLALTDANGNINTSYTYEPFGDTTVSGTNANPYQFTGRENDGTGLYYSRARYYSPTYQRFVAQDPADFAAGDANLYGYVSNDPLNDTDASGLGDVVGPPPGGWRPRPREPWKLPPKNQPPTDIRPRLPRDAPNCAAPGPWIDTIPLDPIIPWVIPIQPFCDQFPGLCGPPMA
jgi:RHS repeat-associated protein